MNTARPGAARRLLARAWAAPCTLVGALLALPLLALGGRLRRVDGVVEIAAAPRPGRRQRAARRLPYCAVTFGHLVIGIDADDLHRLRAHEHAHVRQYERWGPLFLLAYPAAGVLSWLRGGHPYRDNPFEVDARRAEAAAAWVAALAPGNWPDATEASHDA